MAGAKYGDSAYKYGHTTRYYGVDGVNPGGEVQWIFVVDWDNDGSFNYNEAVYMVDLEINRGNRYLVQPGGNGFETFEPGEGSVTLENIGRRFDPDYVGGPLEDKILPGRKFRLLVKDLTTGTVYPVMAGIIYDIPPITEVDRIVFSLRESAFLLDKRISIGILYRNTITDVLQKLLKAAAFPSLFGQTLDDETQYITAFGLTDINALDTIKELGAACLGQVFTSGSGMLNFYSRGHSTMRSIAIDQTDALKRIRRSQPWENLRNIIQVVANKKVKARECAIWQNNGPILLAAYETKKIVITFKDAIDPRLYRLKANSKKDSSGLDLLIGNSRMTKTYMGGIELTLINIYAAPMYFTEIIVMGHPIVDQPIKSVVENALSKTTYGEMVFTMDNPWLQSHNHAAAFATMISNFLDEPERTVELTIEQRPDLQYSMDLMDKIPLTVAKLFAGTQNYYVGRIEHRWQDPTGQAVITTLVLVPRLTDGTAIDNDPINPDLPFIPDPVVPPTPPGDTPPDLPPPGGECLTNPDAGANGPWGFAAGDLASILPVTLQSNKTLQHIFRPVNDIWLRPGGFTNKSLLYITGDWQLWNPGTGSWEGEVNYSNWHVTIEGYVGYIQNIADSGSGTRSLMFYPWRATKISSIICNIEPTTDAAPLLKINAEMAVGTGSYFLSSDTFSTKDDMSYTESQGFAQTPLPAAGAIWSVYIPVPLSHVTHWRYKIKMVGAVITGGAQFYEIHPDNPVTILPAYSPYLHAYSTQGYCHFPTLPLTEITIGETLYASAETLDMDTSYAPGMHYFGLSVREVNDTYPDRDRASFQVLDLEYRINGVYYSMKDFGNKYEAPHRWIIRGIGFANICSK
jgi:hypothetical protein